jgi:probable addiction module antidote protein/putative addiction module killer protein
MTKRARALIASRLDRLAYGHAGDAGPVGDGISELRVHYGPGYRIYFHQRGSRVVILLCGGNKTTQTRDIKTARRLTGNGLTEMTEKLMAYDPAEDLTSGAAIATFMTEAFASEDAGYFAHALGVVARAKAMAQIARQTGLSREQLYRSFSEDGNPTLKTTLAVMKALGIELTAKVPA